MAQIWIDRVSDTGLNALLLLLAVAIIAGSVASLLWRSINRRRIARYEAWLEQQERRHPPAEETEP